MATAYTIIVPAPAAVPSSLEVRVVAMRRDGKELSREELEALSLAYPPPNAVTRAEVARAIAAAPSRPAAKTKVPVSTKARKAPPKRAAAKRP